jgi:hypothetical protein
MLDDRHQQVETGVDDAVDLLGVGLLGEGGEADQVGEDHRDPAPLNHRRAGLGENRAALGAEAGCFRVACVAVRTDHRAST